MQITLTRNMLQSIRETVAHHGKKPELLDIYAAASAIQKLHEEDNVALEDIMAEMLLCIGSNVAVSFIPPEVVVTGTSSGTSIEIAGDGDLELHELKYA